MDFLNLSNDIIISIFLILNIKQILILHKVCKHFNSLDLSNIINLKKNMGFPRINGNCTIHIISKSLMRSIYKSQRKDNYNNQLNYNREYYNYLYDSNSSEANSIESYSSEEFSDSDDSIEIYYKTRTKFKNQFGSHYIDTDQKREKAIFYSNNERSFVNKFIENSNIDIVKGDIVLFNSEHNSKYRFLLYSNSDKRNLKNNKYQYYQTSIFDGIKLIPLSFFDDADEYLPEDFHVIENNVPINYWSNLRKEYKNIPFHDEVLRFNINLVKNQCLENIVCGIIDDDIDGIYTTFYCNQKYYRLIFDYYDFYDGYEFNGNIDLYMNDNYQFNDISPNLFKIFLIEKFKEIISNDENSVFSRESTLGFEGDNDIFIR